MASRPAKQRPGNPYELGQINGVGSGKLQRYGEAMLAALREVRAADGRSGNHRDDFVVSAS